MEILLCVVLNGMTVCGPSLGDPPNAAQGERVGREVCPDCKKTAVAETWKRDGACVEAVNNVVVASAVPAAAEDQAQASAFVDVVVKERVLMFSSPTVRDVRASILDKLRRCLGEKPLIQLELRPVQVGP